MSQYKLIGLSDYARRNLSESDLEELEEMIGSEIYFSERVSDIDGGNLYVMPDGLETHEDFLIVEKLNT